MSDGRIVIGAIVPRQPHPLLCPDAHPGYGSLAESMRKAGQAIRDAGADLILYYSTGWPCVIGHQVQARAEPEWTHVDEEWHELGSIPYKFRMDPEFAAAYVDAAGDRGLHARTVDYHGFPMDTGTVVAQKLMNPDNAVPASAVSCNVYADRAETLVLGKAAADAVRATGRRAAVVAVTALSNRMFTDAIPFKDDHVHSAKDDEWNRKVLEFLSKGRLEDVSQLAREFTAQANADSKLKAIWWLAAAMGQHNAYAGDVLDYQALYGTGAAVATLTPTPDAAQNKEYDEEDVEYHAGDREVLTPAPPPGTPPSKKPLTPSDVSAASAGGEARTAVTERPDVPDPSALEGAAPGEERAAKPAAPGIVSTKDAPDPVGAYPHARRVGDLLYLSGIGPRRPGTDEIPGGPVRDADGKPRDYDAAAQTESVIDNVRTILEASGSSLDRVLDVTCFLVDMDRDFAAFNEVYARHFADIQATRTTVAVRALPTPIAVEFKVVAQAD